MTEKEKDFLLIIMYTSLNCVSDSAGKAEMSLALWLWMYIGYVFRAGLIKHV